MKQMDAFTDGAALRDEGMARAARGADNASPDWTIEAYAVLLTYAQQHGSSLFTSEDVRKYAVSVGLPTPPEPRAWGAVINRAARHGWITPAGFKKSGNAQAHRRPIQQWQAT